MQQVAQSKVRKGPSFVRDSSSLTCAQMCVVSVLIIHTVSAFGSKDANCLTLCLFAFLAGAVAAVAALLVLSPFSFSRPPHLFGGTNFCNHDMSVTYDSYLSFTPSSLKFAAACCFAAAVACCCCCWLAAGASADFALLVAWRVVCCYPVGVLVLLV